MERTKYPIQKTQNIPIIIILLTSFSYQLSSVDFSDIKKMKQV